MTTDSFIDLKRETILCRVKQNELYIYMYTHTDMLECFNIGNFVLICDENELFAASQLSLFVFLIQDLTWPSPEAEGNENRYKMTNN